VTLPLEAVQSEIYLNGLSGVRPGFPNHLHRLEEAARAVSGADPGTWARPSCTTRRCSATRR
jgi:hypothetical protein